MLEYFFMILKRTLTLFTLQSPKISILLKIQDVGGRRLEKIRKIAIISATISLIATKFGTVMHFDLSDLSET